MFLVACSFCGHAQLVWFDGTNPVSYTVSKKADPVVTVALDMFKSDLQQVTGLTPVASPKGISKQFITITVTHL